MRYIKIIGGFTAIILTLLSAILCAYFLFVHMFAYMMICLVVWLISLGLVSFFMYLNNKG